MSIENRLGEQVLSDFWTPATLHSAGRVIAVTTEDRAPRRRGRPRSAGSPTEADPREGIVAAASVLFGAHGVEAVTMSQIADRAGLKQSSIYYWFSSKAEILASILERVNRVPLEIVERAQTTEGPVAMRLHRLVREDVLTLCEFPFDINEVHRLALRSPDEFASYWEERERLHAGVEQLLAEGVANGELRDIDVPRPARRGGR
jgi:AcrR family transcriptional regulator